MNFAFVYFAISWSATLTFAVPSKDTTVIKIRSQYKPQYPIYLSEDGIYDEIFSGDMIIDKSLFMEKIIKSPHKVFLITGPQRFGKSVNLDMAGRFFELLDCWRDEYEQETSEGTIIPRENTTSFELFHNGTLKERFKELEEPLLVSRNKDMLENHQGRYPVIYLPMYSRAVCYETFLNGMIKYHIEQVCKKYEPVIRNAYYHKIEANLSDYATRDRLYKFERYREVSTVNETDLIESVQFLSKLLKDQFNKPPIVIMDGYDFLPTRVLLDNTFEGRRELLEFFKKFFQTTLQDRSLYSKLIISGTLKMKSSIFAGIEDIHDINLLKENEFTPFFGFLREEVDAVFKIAGVSDEFQQKAHDYYNGYKIGNHLIYSPPSIIQCLRKKKVDNFWADEYLSKYFFETVLAFKEIRNQFFNFVHGHPKEINLEDLDITEPEYMGLVTGNHTGFDLVRTVLKIATAKGYFSIKHVSKDIDKIYFPNKELWSTTRTGLIKNLREIPSLIPGYDWEVSDERQDEGELKHFTSLSEELVKFFNSRETTSTKIDELFELNLNNATLKKLIKNKVLIHDIVLYAFLFIENHKKIEHKLNITVVDREAPDANLPYIVAHNNDHGVLLEVVGKKGEPLPEDFHRKHKFPIKTLKYITIDVFRNRTTCVTGQYLDATKLYA